MEKRTTTTTTTKRPIHSSRIPKRKSNTKKGSKIEAPRPLKSSSGNLKVKCPPELVTEESSNEPLTTCFMDVDDESAALSELQQIFGGGMVAGLDEDGMEQPLPEITFPVLGESPSPKEPKKSELPIRAKNPLHLNSTFETWPELIEALALNEMYPMQAMVQDLASQLKLLSLNTPSPPAIDLSLSRNRSYSEPPPLGTAAWTAVGTFC